MVLSLPWGIRVSLSFGGEEARVCGREGVWLGWGWGLLASDGSGLDGWFALGCMDGWDGIEWEGGWCLACMERGSSGGMGGLVLVGSGFALHLHFWRALGWVGGVSFWWLLLLLFCCIVLRDITDRGYPFAFCFVCLFVWLAWVRAGKINVYFVRLSVCLSVMQWGCLRVHSVSVVSPNDETSLPDLRTYVSPSLQVAEGCWVG